MRIYRYPKKYVNGQLYRSVFDWLPIMFLLVMGIFFTSLVRGQSFDSELASEVIYDPAVDTEHPLFRGTVNHTPLLKSPASHQNCDTATESTVAKLIRCHDGNPCNSGGSLAGGIIYEGETKTHGFKLSKKPTSNVKVSVKLPDNTTLPIKIISSISSLTFTPSNWCTLQTVGITAQDNNTKDPIQRDVPVRFNAPGYLDAPLAHRNISVMYRLVYDNDSGQEIEITPASLTLEIPEGGAETFTLKLTAEPSGDGTVSVKVEVTDPDEEVSLSHPTIGVDMRAKIYRDNFAKGESWDRTETVTVFAGQDDDAVDDMVKIRITPRAGGYGFLDPYEISVTVKDDDTAGLIVTPTELDVNEGGRNTYTVQLKTEPTETVTVSITSDNGDVTVDTDLTTAGDQSSLEFTTTNWNTPQIVTVFAAEDDDALEDTATLTNTPSGGDYSSVSPVDVDVTVVENDEVGLIVAPTELDVDEGGSNTYTVQLETQPSAMVTIDITGATGEVTVDTNPVLTGDQTTLTFTSSNWNVAQTVTVLAGEDDDGVNDSATLTNTASGGDYASESKEVEVTVIDDDEIELLVSTSTLTINEGSEDTYDVKLSTEPTTTVTVSIASNNSDVTVDTDSATDGDQITLTFTSSNWNDTQMVRVRAAEDDDGVDDSAVLTNTASGAEYDGKSKEINVTVVDNDDQKIIVDPTAFEMDEEDDEFYTVKLATQPTTTVFVDISVSEGELAPDRYLLRFTTSNWNMPQKVTVIAGHDDDAMDDVVTLTHKARRGDYESVPEEEVTVTVIDDDEAELTVSPSVLNIDEGDSGNYSVRLSTQPSANVTISVTGESGEVTANPKSLTFTPRNWRTPQPVTVSAGQDGDVIDDSATLINTATGANEYASLDPVNVEVNVTDDDEIGLLVSPQSIDVAEGANNTYTVKLATQPTADVTVAIDGSTTDVSAKPLSLTFTTSDWQGERTITVSAEQDPNGADEEVTLKNTASGGGYQSATPVDVVVTVKDDDDPKLVVVPTSLPLNEGSSGTYTVKLSTEPTDDVTVTVRSTSTKVTVDTDINTPDRQSSLLFTSTDWDTPKSVTVTVEQDDDASNDRVIITNTAYGVEYATVPQVSVVVIVTDDDEAALTVTPTDLSIPEGQDDSYTIQLATLPTTNVRVAVTGASAEVSVNPRFLNFSPSDWDQPKSVTVKTIADDDAVNDMAVLTNEASGGEYTSSQSVDVDVTVIDDGRPSTKLTVNSNSIEEGESVTVTIELGGPLADETIIPLEYPDPNATEITDFEPLPSSVTIPAGQARASVDIVTIDDDADEPNELFTVAIDRDQLPSQVKLGTPFSARITIIDNDLPPPTEVTMEVDPTSVVEGEPVTITVKLQSPLTQSLTIPFSYSTGTGNPADPNADYTQLPSLRIAAGQTEKTGEIQTRIDDDVEGPETFAVSFGILPPEVVEGSPVTIGVTILDNLPAISLIADPSSIQEGEETTVSVTMSRPMGINVTIPLILTPGTATPEDYQVQSTGSQVVINSGSISSAIGIIAVDDALIEENEQFDVQLGTLPPFVTEGPQTSEEITIISDDIAGINAETSIVIPEDGQRIVPVSLTAQPSGIILITITGQENSDLDVDPATVEFTPSDWSQPKNLLLTAGEDPDFDNDDVELLLTADGDGFTNVDHTIRVEIIDDDRPGLFVQRTLVINEGETRALNVRLTQLPSDNVTVTLSGYEGTDLSLESQRNLLFTTTNWDEDQRFTLRAEQDPDAIDNQIPLMLAATGGGYDAVSESVEITILDDDDIGIEVTPSSAIVIPEGRTDVFSVALTSEPISPVSITISGYENTDLTPQITRLRFDRSNWQIPQDVRLQSNTDIDSEDDIVILKLSASGGGYDGQQKEVRVIIDDPGAVTINIFSESALERDKMILIPIELDGFLNDVITVQYFTEDETAIAGDDYTASRGIILFDPGATRGVIQLEILEDEVTEEDERFIITLEKPENAVLGRESATATIKDGSSITTIAIEDAIATEDATVITFDVYLSHPSVNPVSVHYSTQDGTASSGEDYEETTGLLTFAPGTVQSSIEVTLLKRNIDWQEETFYVHLESSEAAQIEKSTATAIVMQETKEAQTVLTAYVARFVRTASVNLVEALQERFQLEGSSCTVAQRADMVRLWHTPVEWMPSLGELLSGCRISKTTVSSGGRFGVWGRGSFRQFNGRGEDALTLSADVTTATVGVDYRWNTGWLGGIMVAHSQGDGSYNYTGKEAGALESGLTGIYPYLSYQSSEWELWLSGGYGWGNAAVPQLDGDLISRFGAIGFQGDLVSVHSTRLNYFGDVLLTDAKVNMHGIHAEVIRVRLGMESSFQITSGIRPYLEANVRQDGGDAETGIGLEVGGGLRIAYPQWKIRGEIRSQGLVLHSAEGFTEWGLSGSIQVGNPSKGLSVQLLPSYGPNQGMSLYRQQTIVEYGSPQTGIHRTELEIGYGVPIRKGRARSIVGITQFSGGGQLLRLGGEIRPWDWMSLSVSGLAHNHQSSIGNISLNVQSTLQY